MQGEVLELLSQLARRDRRHERIRVDLPVRMMQRDAHLDAAILERHHVLHVGDCAELAVAIAPIPRRSARDDRAAGCRGSASDPV